MELRDERLLKETRWEKNTREKICVAILHLKVANSVNVYDKEVRMIMNVLD